MADLVFVGPSLPPEEVRRLLPGATVLPPIRHGDLLRLHPQPGDRVLIVDGLFMQTAPVRHREILAVLSRGIAVAGSSSMGALRAAELWPYGMRGVGRVFELYRDGVVTGDDEVAMVYGPAEDGHRALSEPLVDIRLSLQGAAAAGVITADEAHHLLQVACSLPFRARNRRALHRAAPDTDAAGRYLDWARSHPVDVKAADARLLLRTAAETPQLLAPPGAGDLPVRHLQTHHFERWRARHAGEPVAGRWVSDADTATVLMALHPDFPALHRRHVLARLVGAEPAGLTDADLEARAVQLATRRGLLAEPDQLRGSGWLTPAERGLPHTEAALRVLVRAFGSRAASTRSERMLPPELLTAEQVAPARRFVRAALELTDRLSRPDPHDPRRHRFFRPAAIDDVFRRRLRCAGEDELRAAVWDRGFPDLVRFRAVVEPFVGLLSMSDQPRFPAATMAPARRSPAEPPPNPISATRTAADSPTERK